MAILDRPVQTRVGVSYVHVSYHRNQNPEKSQWTVAMPLEREIFETTYEAASGGAADLLWGLWFLDGELQVIGLSRAAHPPQYELKISRFGRNHLPEYWHGYPADYRAHSHDRPPMDILQDWRAAGLITKADASRIRSGKPCNL